MLNETFSVIFKHCVSIFRCREASMFVWQKYEDVKGSNNLFSHVTCATDTENLNAVFTAVTNMIVRSILGDIGVV